MFSVLAVDATLADACRYWEKAADLLRSKIRSLANRLTPAAYTDQPCFLFVPRRYAIAGVLLQRAL